MDGWARRPDSLFPCVKSTFKPYRRGRFGPDRATFQFPSDGSMEDLAGALGKVFISTTTNLLLFSFHFSFQLIPIPQRRGGTRRVRLYESHTFLGL